MQGHCLHSSIWAVAYLHDKWPSKCIQPLILIFFPNEHHYGDVTIRTWLPLSALQPFSLKDKGLVQLVFPHLIMYFRQSVSLAVLHSNISCNNIQLIIYKVEFECILYLIFVLYEVLKRLMYLPLCWRIHVSFI